MKFAEQAFAFDIVKYKFEEELDNLIPNENWERIGWDYYDTSLEIYEASPNLRLSRKAQEFLKEQGFYTTYVNHTDGWTTFYRANNITDRPWRRKDKEGGGFYINYLPKSWVDSAKAAFERGYYEIISDV